MIRCMRLLCAGLLTVAALTSVSRGARATITTPNPVLCTVADVGWDGRVFVDCANTSTRFFTYSSIACPSGTINHNIDDLKMFESLAVAALLSGKSLQINFDPNCEALAGTNVGPIYFVTLRQ